MHLLEVKKLFWYTSAFYFVPSDIYSMQSCLLPGVCTAVSARAILSLELRHVFQGLHVSATGSVVVSKVTGTATGSVVTGGIMGNWYR